MAVDKTLEITYDLTSINQEQAGKLIKANDDVIKKAQKQKQQQKTITKGKNTNIRSFFKKAKLGNLLSFSNNPVSFIGGFATKLVPILGPALLATGVIAVILKRLDNFQKQFIDRVDERIDAFRSREQQALIQAGLTQLIITTSTGSAEPRDSYNSFDVFDTEESTKETIFQMENTSGVN